MQPSARPMSFLLLSLSLLACPSPSPTQEPPDPNGKPDPQTLAEPEQEPDAEPSASTPKRKGPKLPEGPLCDSTADCGEGLVCEGVGCEPGKGRCVDAKRMCTRDLATYCGCDGKEFQSSGSCSGQRFAYRGSCAATLEDGEPCTDGRQCRSGACVGEGLEGCSSGSRGVCGAAACTRDLAVYCSCNGTEFSASGTCPNQQFAYRGPCEGS